MIGFKPNDYVEPEKEPQEAETNFARFRREKLSLDSTEMRDAYRRYNRSHRSL